MPGSMENRAFQFNPAQGSPPGATGVPGEGVHHKIFKILPTLLPMYGIMHLGNKSSDLNDTQYRILSEIRNNPNVTKQQLASILNKGKTTVDNGIAVLREKGYIVRVGSNKTGYWKVQDPDE